MHEMGFVHSDIKPENIVRMEDGTIKLIDFGTAAKIDNTGTAPFLGETPEYMAPENFPGDHGKGSKAADIWSYGASSLMSIMPTLLPDSPDYKRLKDHFPSVHTTDNGKPMKSELADIVSSGDLLQHIPHYADFLSKMLQVEPEKRSSADELLQHPFLQTKG